MDWATMLERFDWFGHIVEALCIAVVVGTLARICLRRREAALVGLAFAAGHFHGREKRDYEVSVQMPPPQIEGYYMWNWSWDQTTDFWPTVIIVLFVAYALHKWDQRDKS